MKKNAILSICLFAFAFFANAQHLTFKGIPITGTCTNFKTKLASQGFTFIYEDNEYLQMEGKFLDLKSMLNVKKTSVTHTVYSVEVTWGEDLYYSEYATNIEEQFKKLKNAMISKYGQPTKEIDDYAWYKGPGIFWELSSGTIEIILRNRCYNCKSGWIYINYIDKAGLKLKEKEEGKIDTTDL